MAKTLGWLVIGMFAAIVALVFVRPMFDTTGGDTMTEAREAAGTMSSSEYRTLSERVTALEARVSEMTLLLEERSSEPTISADSTSSGGRPGKGLSEILCARRFFKYVSS
jgi:hypothetical protein